jgi:GNAT superfamily N-acetyltransferase
VSHAGQRALHTAPMLNERLAALSLRSGGTVVLRTAVADDVPALVEMLADDPLGSAREGTVDGDLTAYTDALVLIDADPGELLVVAEDDGEVVGTLQLSLIPGLSLRGGLRAQLEGVRVRNSHRNRGLGAAMVGWAVDEARRRGAGVVQLTSNKRRTDAHRFYERLGFHASHDGFKLPL